MQYDELPGDMPNAYSYWGLVAGCDPTDVNVDPDGCNGNGNGHVGEMSEGSTSHEGFRGWQHLTLAGILPGNYTGVRSIPPQRLNLNENLPASNIKGSGFRHDYQENWGINGHAIQLASETPLPDDFLIGGSLTPRDARLVDYKLDDGIPKNGKVYSRNASGEPIDCYAGNGATSRYKVENDIIICRLYFLTMTLSN